MIRSGGYRGNIAVLDSGQSASVSAVAIVGHDASAAFVNEQLVVSDPSHPSGIRRTVTIRLSSEQDPAVAAVTHAPGTVPVLVALFLFSFAATSARRGH